MRDGLGQDLRHSARSLRKNPGFTVVTVLTLGLGIGASTVVFSAVRAVLLRDLPYEDADRVVTVFHENRDTGERANGVSAANVRDLRENADGLAEVAVAEPWSMDLQVEGRAESLRAWAVTEGFFRAAGVDAVRGRTFLPEEYALGAEPAVLLSHASWRTRFGGDPSLVGDRITLDGQAVTVVGVLPEAFRLPETAELWLPRPFHEWDDRERTADYMTGSLGWRRVSRTPRPRPPG